MFPNCTLALNVLCLIRSRDTMHKSVFPFGSHFQDDAYMFMYMVQALPDG